MFAPPIKRLAAEAAAGKVPVRTPAAVRPVALGDRSAGPRSRPLPARTGTELVATPILQAEREATAPGHAPPDSAAPIQLKEDPAAKNSKQPAATGLPIRVYITGYLDSEQLLLEIIKQHLGAASDAEAMRIRKKEFGSNLNWSMATAEPITDAIIARGYVWMQVNHPLIAKQQARRTDYFQDLGLLSQAEILESSEQELWGGKDHPSLATLLQSEDPKDKKAKALWRADVDEVIRQHQELEALPELIRDFLTDEPAPPMASAVDVQAALGIAAKIATLSEDELEEFQDNHETATDWAEFGWSIDVFLMQLAQRIEEEHSEKRKLEGKLNATGSDFMDRYFAVMDMPYTIPVHKYASPRGPREEAWEALHKDLIAAGFADGLIGLEQVVRDYEEAFAREAARSVRADIAQQLHFLMLEEKRYQSTDDAEQLGEAVGKTDEVADFDEALAHEVLGFLLPMEFEAQQFFLAAASDLSGRNKVLKAGENHPLLTKPDFDLEGLANAEKDEVFPLLMEDIAERRRSAANINNKLENTEFIFRNDEMFEAALVKQGIPKGSAFEKILRARKGREEVEEIIEGVALMVAGLALGAFSGGTGWIALGAELGSIALDAQSIYSTLDTYQTELSAYKMGLSSEKPSALAAAVSVGLDLIDWDAVFGGISKIKRMDSDEIIPDRKLKRSVEDPDFQPMYFPTNKSLGAGKSVKNVDGGNSVTFIYEDQEFTKLLSPDEWAELHGLPSTVEESLGKTSKTVADESTVEDLSAIVEESGANLKSKESGQIEDVVEGAEKTVEDEKIDEVLEEAEETTEDVDEVTETAGETLDHDAEKLTDVEADAWLNPSRAGKLPLSSLFPGGEGFGHYALAVHLARQRGVRRFKQFLASPEAEALIGDVAKLTAEETAKLEVGFKLAREELDAIAKHGKKLGLSDQELLDMIGLRATEGMSLAETKSEMSALELIEGKTAAELQVKLERIEWSDEVLKKMPNGSAPKWMVNPHRHHILPLDGRTGYERRLIREAQEILRAVGIDPEMGLENLVWAPLKNVHSLKFTEAVVSDLKGLYEAGYRDRSLFVKTLEHHGKIASEM